jgi:hypothetical protein
MFEVGIGCCGSSFSSNERRALLLMVFFAKQLVLLSFPPVDPPCGDLQVPILRSNIRVAYYLRIALEEKALWSHLACM